MKVRKTISFDEDVSDGLNKYRGTRILETLEDKTATKAVNELLREILTQKGYIKNG